jgi:putative flippase GtrA
LLCRKREKVYAVAMQSRLSDRLSAAWHQRAIGVKAVSFGMVGAINFAVDFGVLFLVRAVLMSSTAVTGLADTLAARFGHLDAEQWILIPANLCAWFIAVSGSYVMNSLTTFAHESGGKLRWGSYSTFVASGAAGALTNTAIVVVGAPFAPLWAAKLLATLGGFLVNFSLSHFVVFRKRPENDPR